MVFETAFVMMVSSIGLVPTQATMKDMVCIGEAIFYEARGESMRGKKAIADVILNRVEHDEYPDSICDVVKQPRQFSYRNGLKRSWKGRKVNLTRPMTSKALLESATTAYIALEFGLNGVTRGATHFASKRLKNAWTRKYPKTATIGNHSFYKMM